jgi:hypothetical protein
MTDVSKAPDGMFVSLTEINKVNASPVGDCQLIVGSMGALSTARKII